MNQLARFRKLACGAVGRGALQYTVVGKLSGSAAESSLQSSKGNVYTEANANALQNASISEVFCYRLLSLYLFTLRDAAADFAAGHER